MQVIRGGGSSRPRCSVYASRQLLKPSTQATSKLAFSFDFKMRIEKILVQRYPAL